jgi:hypothetical protein
LDRPRNPDICNRLKANSLIEDVKLYQKSSLAHREIMDTSRLYKLVSSIVPGDDGMLEDPEKYGKFKKILNFKGAVLKTYPFLCSRRNSRTKTYYFTSEKVTKLLSEILKRRFCRLLRRRIRRIRSSVPLEFKVLHNMVLFMSCQVDEQHFKYITNKSTVLFLNTFEINRSLQRSYVHHVISVEMF